jgi:hypothetical protein
MLKPRLLQVLSRLQNGVLVKALLSMKDILAEFNVHALLNVFPLN